MNATVTLQWSQDYETGIDIIDQQHRQLFEYFALIEDQIGAGQLDQLPLVVRGLVDYAISHNTFEESLMEQASYPMLTAHRRVHEAFRQRALGYVARLDEGEEPMKLAREVRIDIGLWLINHIKREDRHYVPYVRKVLEPGIVSGLLRRFFR